MPPRESGETDGMEGGIALFLLFIIIVVALVLAFFFTGLGASVGAYRERRSGRKPPRPTHAVVSDDGSSTAKPGDHLPE
jgi:hypothetical protein